MKMKKKNSSKSASLIEHFRRTLERISVSLNNYIKSLVFIFHIKTEAEEIFLSFLSEK